jgi:hypothetical protein
MNRPLSHPGGKSAPQGVIRPTTPGLATILAGRRPRWPAQPCAQTIATGPLEPRQQARRSPGTRTLRHIPTDWNRAAGRPQTDLRYQRPAQWCPLSYLDRFRKTRYRTGRPHRRAAQTRRPSCIQTWSRRPNSGRRSNRRCHGPPRRRLPTRSGCPPRPARRSRPRTQALSGPSPGSSTPFPRPPGQRKPGLALATARQPPARPAPGSAQPWPPSIPGRCGPFRVNLPALTAPDHRPGQR